MIHEVTDNLGKKTFLVLGVFGSQFAIAAEEDEPIVKLKAIAKSDGQEIFKKYQTKAEAEAYLEGIADRGDWERYTLTDLSTHNKIFGFEGTGLKIPQLA